MFLSTQGLSQRTLRYCKLMGTAGSLIRRPCRDVKIFNHVHKSVLVILRCKQLPMSLGDDFYDAVGYFNGGLIVNRI